MVGERKSNEDRSGTEIRSLGDLLYADETKSLVFEGEWVRLVESIAAGDQRALHALYERTYRIVFTLIARIVDSRETAEELTLDVFHDVWRRARTYDPAGRTVLGWIMVQARSRAIDRLRFERRKKRANPGAESPLAAAAASNPNEALDAMEEGRRLRNALTALTEAERQAIETAFFGELTYAEAAARLSEPLGTIKTRIRSGLAKLRRVLTGPDEEP